MKAVLLFLVVALFLPSCATVPPGPGGPPVRTVLMPNDLDEREVQYLGQIASILQRNGYQPANRGPAEYKLEFSIETGPVNADATLRLMSRSGIVAEATGRDGGPRIIFDRNGVARNAANRCFDEFEPQLRGYRPPVYDSRW
ncbi:MAG: hypothetical protein JNJ83_00170 [Verrucomicrobiaceae bacterium]|nr:hypothetical protein [Verrucomicrobiaceae bacterium]